MNVFSVGLLPGISILTHAISICHALAGCEATAICNKTIVLDYQWKTDDGVSNGNGVYRVFVGRDGKIYQTTKEGPITNENKGTFAGTACSERGSEVVEKCPGRSCTNTYVSNNPGDAWQSTEKRFRYICEIC